MAKPSDHWLDSNDPQYLLQVLRSTQEYLNRESSRTEQPPRYRVLNERQQWLFGCACCRRIGHLLPDDRIRAAVSMAERFADDRASQEEVNSAQAAALAALREVERLDLGSHQLSVYYLGLFVTVPNSAHVVANSATNALWAATDGDEEAVARERVGQAELLRHITGDPFRGNEQLAKVPATVQMLAQALYDGEDCAFALHDALLDANLEKFARHFEVGNHPKGCWALDRLMGK